MTAKLADRTCVPCLGGALPIKGNALRQWRNELGGNWETPGEHHLEKTYALKDFRAALDFTNAVGALAEQEGHHPEITLTWGKVTLRIWTHKIDGLTESDFILAAKADHAFQRQEAGRP